MLPERYYLDYFHYLLDFVSQYYRSILDVREWNFLEEFASLSIDAQALYVRMINRKGIFFKPHHFRYTEISSVKEATEELLARNFMKEVGDLEIFEKVDYLDSYTKDQLLQGFFTTATRNEKKEQLISRLIRQFAWQEVLDVLQTIDKTYQLLKRELVEWFFFLFFGYSEKHLTEFVLRDLGRVRFEYAQHNNFVPRFTQRQDVYHQFLARQQYALFKKMLPYVSIESLLTWYKEQWSLWEKFSGQARYFIDKLSLRLGQFLEKEGKTDEALTIYAQTDLPPARERRVRLMLKQYQHEQALTLCHEIWRNPANADELLLAIDTIEKYQGKKFKKTTTAFLENATTISLVKTEESIERCVLRYFREQGEDGFFAENHLWNALFGLAFWDVIFDKAHAHHPLERYPYDFGKEDFFEQRREKFLQKAQIFDQPNLLQQIVFQTFEQKRGTANPLLNWHDETCIHLEKLFQHVQTAQLKEVVLQMAKDLKNYAKGFPDLFVFGQRGGRFVEIKSPTDQLSAQQLYWIQFFQRIGISVEVVRVRWKD
ncbi:MAG: VRR-NUC domain-containing protein [Flammeovirgaceae bacterium]|nr:VRR-NUC domain-containing protein [Flammeovirgaceae bacterium]MDW8286672.1 VRR-NUC domain-containing protein [Flammeovirgaceae bacterium]